MEAKDLARQIAFHCSHNNRPTQSDRDQWLTNCCAHDDKNPSLSVGVSQDGTSVLVHCKSGCSQEHVIERLKADGIWPEKETFQPKERSIYPAPYFPADEDVRMPDRSEPDKVYRYFMADGHPAFLVLRKDAVGETPKQIRQMAFVAKGYEEGKWLFKHPPANVKRPLYNLLDVVNEELLPEKRKVVVAEGEKACDAGKELYPQYIWVSPSQGTQSVSKTDWSPLHEREVIIFFDNDKAGVKGAEQVANQLTKLKPKFIPKIVFNEINSDLPVGWDVADDNPDIIDVSHEIENASEYQGKEEHEYVAPGQVDEILKKYNDKYKTLLQGGEPRYVDISAPLYLTNNGVPYRILKNEKALKAVEREKFFDVVSGKPRAEIDVFLKEVDVPILDGTQFDPSTEKTVIKRGSHLFLNTFAGYISEPKAGNGHQPFLDHINAAISDGSEWFLDWLADIVQNPARKPGTAVILRGKPGSGKSVIGNVMAAMIGDRHAFVGSFHARMGSSFSGEMGGKIFVQLDEMEMGKQNQKSVESAIKVATTDKYININVKFGAAWTEQSFHRFLYTTNAGMAIPVYVDDRRLAVFDVDPGTTDPDHFTGLWDLVTNSDALGNLLHYLKERKIAHDVRRPPETASREDMVAVEDTFIRYLMDCFDAEDLPASWGRKVAGDGVDWAYSRVAVGRKCIYESYEAWCLARKMSDERGRMSLGRKLGQISISTKSRVWFSRPGQEDMLDTLLYIPKRSEARDMFAIMMGSKIMWGTGEQDDERAQPVDSADIVEFPDMEANYDHRSSDVEEAEADFE